MPEPITLSVTPLNSAAAAAIADVLCEAFRDYPVMRFILGSDGNYNERLQVLIGLFVGTRTLRGDPMFGVYADGRLVAAMTTSNPADPPHPDFAALRDAVWLRLGADAKERYDRCADAWLSMEYKVPQLHVNMIGVRDAYRGKRLARQLLDHIQAICDETPGVDGVSLTTELPQNVQLYQHVGYRVVGATQISDTLPTWNLFRDRTRS